MTAIFTAGSLNKYDRPLSRQQSFFVRAGIHFTHMADVSMSQFGKKSPQTAVINFVQLQVNGKNGIFFNSFTSSFFFF